MMLNKFWLVINLLLLNILGINVIKMCSSKNVINVVFFCDHLPFPSHTNLPPFFKALS